MKEGLPGVAQRKRAAQDPPQTVGNSTAKRFHWGHVQPSQLTEILTKGPPEKLPRGPQTGGKMQREKGRPPQKRSAPKWAAGEPRSVPKEAGD